MNEQIFWATLAILALLATGWLLFQRSSQIAKPRHASDAWTTSPHAVTYGLVILNAIMFALCLIGNSIMEIDWQTLRSFGAMDPDLTLKEPWRLVTSAFLHLSLMHFGMNMIALVVWGSILEKRAGAAYYLIIYMVSAVCGNLASLSLYSVGASGALAGIVGGLFYLRNRLGLTPQFFVVTIGLNAFLSLQEGVNWRAHLGGLIAGFICTAVLDLAERFNPVWLKCKFPEFVKFAIVIAAPVVAVLIFRAMPQASQNGLAMPLAAWAVAMLMLLKLIDLILAHKKGLGIVTLACIGFYGALPLIFNADVQYLFALICEQFYKLASSHQDLNAAMSYIETAIGAAPQVPYFLALFALITAFLKLSRQLVRGLYDVGFVAPSLEAERNRKIGL